MKYECEIVQDLLPLYVEDMVSDKTKEMIEAHLKECDVCYTMKEEMIQTTIAVTPPKIDDLKSFRFRIIFEIIMGIIVELAAMNFIYSKVYASENSLRTILFEVYVFLPLVSFLVSFHVSRKSIRQGVLAAVSFTIMEILCILPSAIFYSLNIYTTGFRLLVLSAGLLGLLPSLIGTIAVRLLIYCKKKKVE